MNRLAIAAAATAATLTAAIPIKTECVIKGPLVGNTSDATATVFDETAFAVANLDTTSELTKAFACVDANGNLQNLRIGMTGPDGSDNFVEGFGPAGGSCALQTVTQTGKVGGRIFYDTNQVNGVEFFYSSDPANTYVEGAKTGSNQS